MQIKLSPSVITIKITPEELENLAEKQTLFITNCVGPVEIRYECSVGDKSEPVNMTLMTEYNTMRFLILISEKVVADLSALGRHKEGLSYSNNGQTTILQVDVRNKRQKER